MRYFIIIFLFILIVGTFFKTTITTKYNYVVSNNYLTSINVDIKQKEKAISTFYGIATAYGPDCDGCIGITASGYDVRNTIYYDDIEYGKVRILAFDKNAPFGTIIRLSDNDISLIAIVLDRGSAIGYNKSSQADLLYSNEDDSNDFGRKYNVKFEILRFGY